MKPDDAERSSFAALAALEARAALYWSLVGRLENAIDEAKEEQQAGAVPTDERLRQLAHSLRLLAAVCEKAFTVPVEVLEDTAEKLRACEQPWRTQP